MQQEGASLQPQAIAQGYTLIRSKLKEAGLLDAALGVAWALCKKVCFSHNDEIISQKRSEKWLKVCARKVRAS